MKEEGSRYKGQLIINWGSSSKPARYPANARWINTTEAVAVATDKIRTFQALGEVSHVPWTTNKEEAQKWLEKGSTVLARTVLNGHSGRGIVVVRPGDVLPNAPLYTKYVKKVSEFRVHCSPEVVIDLQQKKKRNGAEADPLIRSHERGWVFCRDNVTISEDGKAVAKAAVAALGLNFGAVDIIYNERYNKFFVCEINTAPGIEGTTVDNYAAFFRNL